MKPKQKLTQKEIKKLIKLAQAEIKEWQSFLKRVSKLLIILAIFSLGFIPSRSIVYKAEAKESEYKVIQAEITAYSPHKSQTDNTPDINAMGLKVQEGDIANNCLKFGSKVQIGETIFTVRDRLNSRYDCSHYDILMFSNKEALEYGRQNRVVRIIKI